MKYSRKFLINFMVILLLTLGISSNVSASTDNFDSKEKDEVVSEIFVSSSIPNEMEPGSIIIYVSETEFTIEKGNVVSASFDDISYIPDVKEDGVIYESYPDPVKGLVVTYASDGFIDKLTYPEDVQNPLLEEKLTPPESAVTSRKQENLTTYSTTIGGFSCETYSVVAKWGAYPNTLYNCVENTGAYSSSKNIEKESEIVPFGPAFRKYRIGIGRATTFSDEIGQANIRLQKGDAATKLAYDNVSVGTVLRVSTKNSSGVMTQKALVKRDAGGMPNAVLDIWKTGVEYWGYTWNSSFSMPNSVTYYYEQ